MNVRQTYECKECKDTEFIYDVETNTARYCKCYEAKRYKKMIKNSGISEAFQKKTINEYKPKNNQQSEARQIAVEYITNFNEIQSQRNNSIAFLGQVGAGKTHLTIAIANALLKQNIGILYMQYREAMTQLKQSITDEVNHQKELSKYKKAPVLLIDDLFKGLMRNGQPNESELRIMFEIVNHRYLKQSPIIVSSECFIDKLIDFDEAVGSRIADMCKTRVIEFSGIELNHRMV